MFFVPFNSCHTPLFFLVCGVFFGAAMHLFFYQKCHRLFVFCASSVVCGDLIDRDLAKLNNPVTVLSAITKTFPFVVLRVELYGYNERVLFVQLTITSTFSRAHLFWQNFTATCWKRDILEG